MYLVVLIDYPSARFALSRHQQPEQSVRFVSLPTLHILPAAAHLRCWQFSLATDVQTISIPAASFRGVVTGCTTRRDSRGADILQFFNWMACRNTLLMKNHKCACGHVDEPRVRPGRAAVESLAKRHGHAMAVVFVGVSVFPSLHTGTEMVRPLSSSPSHLMTAFAPTTFQVRQIVQDGQNL